MSEPEEKYNEDFEVVIHSNAHLSDLGRESEQESEAISYYVLFGRRIRKGMLRGLVTGFVAFFGFCAVPYHAIRRSMGWDGNNPQVINENDSDYVIPHQQQQQSLVFFDHSFHTNYANYIVNLSQIKVGRSLHMHADAANVLSDRDQLRAFIQRHAPFRDTNMDALAEQFWANLSARLPYSDPSRTLSDFRAVIQTLSSDSQFPNPLQQLYFVHDIVRKLQDYQWTDDQFMATI